jgi:hypothetical protein
VGDRNKRIRWQIRLSEYTLIYKSGKSWSGGVTQVAKSTCLEKKRKSQLNIILYFLGTIMVIVNIFTSTYL